MTKTLIKNKKATFKYEIITKFECGIVLKGTEMKPLKNADASISEAYCLISNNEVFIKGMYIKENQLSHSHFNHKPLRDKKLLLTKKQISKLIKELKVKGQTLIPLKVYVNETNLVKITIALCKGKNNRDKKNKIKERDISIDTNRILKNYN